jgi:hypothetical protein
MALWVAVDFSTTVSIFKNVQRRTVGSLANEELERTFKTTMAA